MSVRQHLKLDFRFFIFFSTSKKKKVFFRENDKEKHSFLSFIALQNDLFGAQTFPFL